MLALAAANASVIPLGYPYAYSWAPQIALSQGVSPYLASPLAYNTIVAAPGQVVAGPGQVVAAHGLQTVVSAPAPAVVAGPAGVPVA